MTNVFKDVPYKEDGMGNRKVIDEKHLLIMQIALKPGQSVPQHNANSNVHIVVLKGRVLLMLGGESLEAVEGSLVPVAFKTPMSIKNAGEENATFLVLKTPNPSEMK